LFVGTLDPRKNVARLIDAYARTIESGGAREHLVIAGQPGWQRSVPLERLPTALRERVHFLGYVPDNDLPYLYAGATVFAYPSLMEGFGFPPLEAMACGTPVIASNLSALRENLEGAACLVSPGDTQSIAAAIRRMLEDAQFRERHREAGLQRAARFRWDTFARATAACYEEIVQRRKPTSAIAAAQT
jgi:glycosyltransferase involved in cell wall biosynthesis